MNDPVAIIGAGPVGLAAALFLHERGIPSRLYDAADEPTRTSKALVVNPRTLSLLAGTDVAKAIIDEGRRIRGVAFYEDWRSIAALDTTDALDPYQMTVLTQARTEALLAEALARRDIAPQRGARLTALEQDAGAVTLRIANERVVAPIAIAADGAHSTVRGALGIDFVGSAYPEEWPLADLELDDPLDLDYAHVCFVERGFVFMVAIVPGLWRVFANVPDMLAHLPPGSSPGKHHWDSSFHISHRRAPHVALGRIALVGDAAHVHSPLGARGMNLGVEDAWTLAGCLAAAPADPVAALAHYDVLRRPVHRMVVHRMAALTRLARGRPSWIGIARRLLIPMLTEIGPARVRIRDFMTGLAPAANHC